MNLKTLLDDHHKLIDWYDNNKEEQHIPDDLPEIEMSKNIEDILSLEDKSTETKIISIIK